MILFLSFIITFLALLALTKTRLARFAVDLPNHRSLHDEATPRTGGLAIMLGVFPVVFISNNHLWIYSLCFLVIISILDDRFHVKAKWRFLAHALIAIYFVWMFFSVSIWLRMALVLSLIWMINLYNFMDGADGLAGGMAFFGFSAYALGFHWAGMHDWAFICMCIVAAVCAFLLFNFHPAKIFMGDAGSIPLGFLAGALGLWGWCHQCWPLWFPILVFSPFIVDASITLFRRAWRREKVWQAHREHYYQRLIQLGWGHCKTAIAEYILMLACGVSALFLIRYPQFSWVLLGGWVLIYGLIGYWVDRLWQDKLRNRLS